MKKLKYHYQMPWQKQNNWKKKMKAKSNIRSNQKNRCQYSIKSSQQTQIQQLTAQIEKQKYELQQMKKQNRSISIQKDEYSFQHQKELNDYQQQIRELLAEKEAKQKENDKLISQNRQQNPHLNSSIDQKTQRIKKSRLSKKYSRNYLIYFVNQETTMRFPQLKITTIEKKWIQCQFNQGFIIEQSIEFNTKEISGAMIDNFEYLVTWDLGNSKFSVRKIKGRSEQYQHKV